MRAAQVGLNEADIARSLQESLSGSFKVAPTFWINPKNGVAYPIVAQTPQYWLDSMSSLENIPASREDASQILGGLATIRRGVSPAVVSHYAVQPVIDIYRDQHRSRSRRGLRRYPENRRRDRKRAAARLDRRVARADPTMTYAYSQLFVGIALAIVLIYLLIVVNFQSWLDPFVIVSALPTALAGIVWMLFITHTTLSVPALTGAIMCMGVATANSILVVSFARERLAEGADAADRGDRRRLHPFPAGADDGAGDDHRHGADGAQRRTERAARPRGDRRPHLLDRRDAVVRAGGLPARSRAQAEPGERTSAEPSRRGHAHMSQDQAEPQARGPEAQTQGLQEHPPARRGSRRAPEADAEQPRPVKAGRAILILSVAAIAVGYSGISGRRQDDEKLKKWTEEQAIPPVAVIALKRGGEHA